MLPTEQHDNRLSIDQPKASRFKTVAKVAIAIIAACVVLKVLIVVTALAVSLFVMAVCAVILGLVCVAVVRIIRR